MRFGALVNRCPEESAFLMTGRFAHSAAGSTGRLSHALLRSESRPPMATTQEAMNGIGRGTPRRTCD